VILLAVPPLRERREDIPTLCRYFLERGRAGGEAPSVTERALECLERYDWPGNVRELENVVRRAAALGKGLSLDIDALPSHIAASAAPARFPPAPPSVPGPPGTAALSGYEERAIRDALAAVGGNRKKAAAALGIGEATLYRKIKKYGLSSRGA